MKDKNLPLSQDSHPEACTHVRLGAGHGGDPRLPGQHGSDVEVCDVHVSWRERSTTENVKSSQPSGRAMLLYQARSVNSSVLWVLAVKAQLFCPQDHYVLPWPVSSVGASSWCARVAGSIPG